MDTRRQVSDTYQVMDIIIHRFYCNLSFNHFLIFYLRYFVEIHRKINKNVLEKKSSTHFWVLTPQRESPPCLFTTRASSMSQLQQVTLRPSSSNVFILIVAVACLSLISFFLSPLTQSTLRHLLHPIQRLISASNSSSLSSSYSIVSQNEASNYSDSTMEVENILDGKRKKYTENKGERNKTNHSNTPTSTIIPENMKQCGHTILFTAPRHGSSWFIDCIENCSFSVANYGQSFGNANSLTELWNIDQKSFVETISVVDISVNDAINYVKYNLSIKLFPREFRERIEDSMKFVLASYKNGVPIVILRRNPESASRSLAIARKDVKWNINSNGAITSNNDTERTDIYLQDEQNLAFINSVKLHYDLVDQKLSQLRIPFDSVNYEEIKIQQYIVLPKNQCYVRNCNY